jgi:hypothetical protein
MILKALNHNSEEAIAGALAVDVRVIRQKRDLLRGVCSEAIDLLKDKRTTARTFAILRKMKPTRQVEAARLMIATNLFSGQFAKALLAGTREELLVEGGRSTQSKAVLNTQKRWMEQETDALLQSMSSVEASYGEDVLALGVSCRYAGKVLSNSRLQKHLRHHHAEIFDEIRRIVEAVDADTIQPPSPATN